MHMEAAPDPIKPTEGRVLVAEDVFYLADDMAEALQARGFTIVGPVGRVQAAAEFARTEPLAAAILDINRKQELIYPVVDILRARGVPVLFATGYDRDTIPETYAQIPCWQKPVDLQDLLGALERLTAEARPVAGGRPTGP